MIAMGFLDFDTQQRVYYERIEGEAERPCLVFLHEGLGCVSQWSGFPHRLCQRTGCPGLLYDRLGHGLSSPLGGSRGNGYLHACGLSELPKVLEGLIPGQRFILVGHSDGGSISLIYAAEQPSLLVGVVTIAAHVLVEQETVDGVIEAQRAWDRGKLKKGLARLHGDKAEALFRAWADVWTSPSFRTWSIVDRLPAIVAPLLVLQGRNDQYGTAAQVDAIVASAGGPVTPLLLEDCGHAPHLDFPELALDLTACFVNRVAR